MTFPPSAAAGAGGFAPLLLADPVVFAISSNGNLWEHNANLTAGQSGAAPEGTTDANLYTISSGVFTALTAVMDFGVGGGSTLTPGHPVVYAVTSGSGNVWEHNTDLSAGAAEGTTDANWAQISSGDFVRLSATVEVQPANAGAPATVNPLLFGAIQGSGNLWEHNALFNPAGEFLLDANWSELSTGQIGEFAAAFHTTSSNGAEPAVFALPADFNLWEHYLSATPVGSEGTTDANWTMLSTGLPFANAPIAPVVSTAPTANTLLTLNLNPLDINLLGLRVQTNQIQVTVSAQPGQGELLGNVLTDASNLLNLQGVNNALNNVLGSVVTLLNSTSLSIAGVNTTSGSLSNATAAVTPVLDLFVAPVHLNLLGALVDTSPIHLTITAQSGQGLVLGNVITDLANLFNPPLPSTLNLDTINNSLTQLLGELNQQIPNIGSSPTTNSTPPLGADQVVSLNVPPINLDLLGLVLQTSQIQVNADAITGNGELLGNVLTTLLNTLGATPQNLTTLSDNLNALLAKVVGVLNASSLILPSNALSSLDQTLQTLALPNLVNATGTASTPILNLAIASTNGSSPPVNVNLLGLQVTTSNIQAQLLAQTGDGQILGNLLFNVANLLNPGSSLSLLSILSALSL